MDMDMEMDMHMDMNGTHCSDDMMSMKMAFFFGYQCSLLFSSLNLETPGQLFGGILLVLIVAILYEGLKTFREILASRGAKKAESETNINAGSEKEPLVTHAGGSKSKTFLHHVVKEYCNTAHIFQSCLLVVQVGVAYLLMLVAMTYNGWLFLAVCVGAGIGYFIFGKCRKSLSDFRAQSEHCH